MKEYYLSKTLQMIVFKIVDIFFIMIFSHFKIIDEFSNEISLVSSKLNTMLKVVYFYKKLFCFKQILGRHRFFCKHKFNLNKKLYI